MTPENYHLGLIGYPLEHSLSPRLHQAALNACGLSGEYRLISIHPGADQMRRINEHLDAMRAGLIHGLNVTIPYKQIVIGSLDHLTATAETIGAVNTIYLDGDQLLGENTDAPGFLADLQKNYSPQIDRTCLAIILGAGGAARGVAYALIQSGWRVVVAARRVQQAQKLITEITGKSGGLEHMATSFTPENLRALLESRRKLGSSDTLIVNTTPVGMYPHSDNTPWPEEIPFPEWAFVYDLVYNPSETKLVVQARKEGVAAVNGLGMLVEQAALAFECWTGNQAPREHMLRSVSMEGG